MVMKSKVFQINDKRFHFADVITSLPLSRRHLQGLNDFQTQRAKDQALFWGGERNLIRNRKFSSRIK